MPYARLCGGNAIHSTSSALEGGAELTEGLGKHGLDFDGEVEVCCFSVEGTRKLITEPLYVNRTEINKLCLQYLSDIRSESGVRWKGLDCPSRKVTSHEVVNKFLAIFEVKLQFYLDF